MKRIILLTFNDDADIYDGLSKLLEQQDAKIKFEVLIPVNARGTFCTTALMAVQEAGVPFRIYLAVEESIDGLEDVGAERITICMNPTKELVNQVTSDDILAMVWDDSTEAHMTLHALEDFGLEVWNISHGLDAIEIDYREETSEDLFEVMQDTLTMFIETFSAYVISSILDVLTETITERLDSELGTKDVSPFKDDDE